MNITNERCTWCNRRNLLTNGCLRKWLRPKECKHVQRTKDNKGDYTDVDTVSVIHKERNPPTSKFVKLWKNKFFISTSVRSLQRYFTKKQNAAADVTLCRHTCADVTSISKDLSLRDSDSQSTSSYSEYYQSWDYIKHCPHPDGRGVLRVHQRHTSREPCSFRCELSEYGWYWGGINSIEAEEIMAGHNENVFLVRDLLISNDVLCLSYRCVGLNFHSRLTYDGGLFSLDDHTFVPASNLLEHCARHNKYSRWFCIPECDTKPLNRFEKLDSLQKLCRFVIRQSVPAHSFQNLPLPKVLINYVSQGSDISPYR